MRGTVRPCWYEDPRKSTAAAGQQRAAPVIVSVSEPEATFNREAVTPTETLENRLQQSWIPYMGSFLGALGDRAGQTLFLYENQCIASAWSIRSVSPPRLATLDTGLAERSGRPGGALLVDYTEGGGYTCNLLGECWRVFSLLNFHSRLRLFRRSKVRLHGLWSPADVVRGLVQPRSLQEKESLVPPEIQTDQLSNDCSPCLVAFACGTQPPKVACSMLRGPVQSQTSTVSAGGKSCPPRSGSPFSRLRRIFTPKPYRRTASRRYPSWFLACSLRLCWSRSVPRSLLLSPRVVLDSYPGSHA